MRRFNIFQTSHSALRAQLLDASLQLQFTNFTKPQQVQHRFDQVIELVLACQRQAEEESRYIIPALLVFEKKVPECFAASQQVRNSPLDRILDHMLVFDKEAGSDRANKWAGVLFRASFRKLSDWVIQAMQRQEEMLNPLLWKHYSDDALYMLQLRIEGKQPLSEWLELCSWMIKDMDDEDIAIWLNSMESGLPAPVFELLLEKILGQLPLLKWDMVEERKREERRREEWKKEEWKREEWKKEYGVVL
ncbi:hypothetical protein GCM10027036_11910 [Flavihumibacter cheonanensis]|uniref:hypothetical protein n=1 Tax=Flavihumibacter cheonanensis TaxID=1442385 RepID=UPI001EF77701|nr:hypothetical protein [Flavihumibacter cheonanensis]MCG7751369.1 hypothetical protein [Flavihumibacter cheonanensis]